MKKFFLIVVASITTLFANWFGSDAPQKTEPILTYTPYATFKNKVGHEPMMIEFGSINCHSCIKMGNILYKIKAKYPKANIYFIDIYQDKETTSKYKIQLIPTQKYIDKSGKVVDTHMGLVKQDELERKLKKMGII